jgi:hypothetical protein
MRLLGLDLPPVTDSVGFLSCPIRSAVDAFLGWQRPLLSRRGIEIAERRVSGVSATDVVCSAMPVLTSIEPTRQLFVGTLKGDGVFFLENGADGADPYSVCSYLAEKLGCTGVRMDLIDDDPRAQRYGATVLEVYERGAGALSYRRAISCINDGGSWVFATSGEPYSFEQHNVYAARRIRDRFPPDLLAEYLEHLEVPALDPGAIDWSNAVVLSKSGGFPPGMQTHPLAGCG